MIDPSANAARLERLSRLLPFLSKRWAFRATMLALKVQDVLKDASMVARGY